MKKTRTTLITLCIGIAIGAVSYSVILVKSMGEEARNMVNKTNYVALAILALALLFNGRSSYQNKSWKQFSIISLIILLLATLAKFSYFLGQNI